MAVIENEYGEVGVDDALVMDTKEEIFEMNNVSGGVEGDEAGAAESRQGGVVDLCDCASHLCAADLTLPLPRHPAAGLHLLHRCAGSEMVACTPPPVLPPASRLLPHPHPSPSHRRCVPAAPAAPSCRCRCRCCLPTTSAAATAAAAVRGDLIRILNKLLKRKNRFDHILIETTGLADPAPVAQTFFVDDDLKAALRLDSILTGGCGGRWWWGGCWGLLGGGVARGCGCVRWPTVTGKGALACTADCRATLLQTLHPPPPHMLTHRRCRAALPPPCIHIILRTVVDCKHILLHLDEVKPDDVVNESVQQVGGWGVQGGCCLLNCIPMWPTDIRPPVGCGRQLGGALLAARCPCAVQTVACPLPRSPHRAASAPYDQSLDLRAVAVTVLLQVAFADKILLNKTDLVTPAQKAHVVSRLKVGPGPGPAQCGGVGR